MNKASKKMLRCLSLVFILIILLGVTSCSKEEDKRNTIEMISTQETVPVVEEDSMFEKSNDEESVDSGDTKKGDQEVDGRNLYEASKKLHPGDGKAGAGFVGNKKHITEIRDIDGTLMATFENASGFIPVENGIVYNWTEGSGEICSYYYYDFDSKETTLLGRVENFFVAMSYDNMCIGNKLYILLNDKNDNSFLCIIDTQELSFKKVALGTNMSRFCSMTYYDGFVYYFTADTASTESIYKYDPRSDKITKIRDYGFDTETFTGETLLHLATDADHLYVLKAESQGIYNSHLFVDMYDNKLDLIKRIELTDRIHEFTKNLITEEIYGELGGERAKQIKDDEIRQPVYGFDIRNGILYFENRSLTRLLEKLEPDNRGDSKDITQMNFHMIGAENTEITSGDYCFYDTKSQLIYLYDPYTSILQTGQLKVNGETIDTIGIAYGRGGKLLIYKSGESITSSAITGTIYYIDKTELAQSE